MGVIIRLIVLASYLQAIHCGYLQWSLLNSNNVTGVLMAAYKHQIYHIPKSEVQIMSDKSTEVPAPLIVTSTTWNSTHIRLSGLTASTGDEQWRLFFAYQQNQWIPQVLSTAVVTSQPANKLNLLFVLANGQLHAVNSAGQIQWSRTETATQVHLSGWQNSTASATPTSSIISSSWSSGSIISHIIGGGSKARESGGALYLSEVQPLITTAPLLQRNTTVTAFVADTGVQLWRTNITARGTPAFGVSPIVGVVATPSLALYPSGNVLGAIHARTGAPTWHYQWYFAGTGLTPNITDVQYVELISSGERLILLTSVSWQQQRYAVLRLYDSVEQAAEAQVPGSLRPGAGVGSSSQAAPLRLLWQSLLPEAALAAFPALLAPTVSAQQGLFYSWTNTTIYYPNPSWEMALVGRSLLTGDVVWRLPLPRGSLSGEDILPVEPPVALNDRLVVVTTAGLTVLHGSSGGYEWGVGGSAPHLSAAAPHTPPLTHQPHQGDVHLFASRPRVAFTDNAGYLVAMRCLDHHGQRQQQHQERLVGSLCVYGGYARAPLVPTMSAAAPGRRFAVCSGVLALGLAVGWALLL